MKYILNGFVYLRICIIPTKSIHIDLVYSVTPVNFFFAGVILSHSELTL